VVGAVAFDDRERVTRNCFRSSFVVLDRTSRSGTTRQQWSDLIVLVLIVHIW
jgi:hypothetical protein